MRRILMLAALLAACSTTPTRADEPAAAAGPQATGSIMQPYVAVRSLQAVQDQVARGSTAAQNALPALLTHLAEVFAAAGPAAWKDQRNVEAAALYLFSAGRPAVVRNAIDGADLTPAGRKLVDGALAYAEGYDDRARSLLGTLEPRSLSRGIGGHLALVLAALYADTDPRKAGEMLDQARLLVPGTLVEEAALRRQIFLLAQPTTAERFAMLSRQYLRRFHASIFAGNFKARLRSFTTDLASAGDTTALARLDPILGDLSAAEARSLYLSLARGALVHGHLETARFAATRASGFAPEGGEKARARLYTAAADAASENAAAAAAALKAIEPGSLPADDQPLRSAALAVSSSIDAAAPVSADDPAAPTRTAAASDAAATDLMAKGDKALATADAILGGTP